MSDVPAVDPAYQRRRWTLAVVVVVAIYAILSAAAVLGSPMDRVDLFFFHLNLAPRKSELFYPVSYYVFIGQGVPASTLAALYAIRRSRRTQAWRPWVMFVLALFLLNASVGAVKHLIGRLGPQATDTVHTVWAGGTIFPSGHAANAVVMYGLIAMLVPVAHRKIATILAVVLSTTVGLGTVALNTHWISDVFAGWAAGALVLLMLWPLTPPVDRVVTRAADRMRPAVLRWWATTPFRPLGTARPAVGAQRSIAADDVSAVADASDAPMVNIAGPGASTTPPASESQHRSVGHALTREAPSAGARGSHVRGDAGGSIAPHRIDGRHRSIRRPITETAPATAGSRSQPRERRHQSLSQGS